MQVSPRSLLGLVLVVLCVSAASQWWAGRQERQVGEQVAALAEAGDIHMLSSDTCGICAMARAWFRQHQVKYTECSIESDAACKAAFEASGSPGTPVMVVRGKAQVGFAPERLQQALQHRG